MCNWYDYTYFFYLRMLDGRTRILAELKKNESLSELYIKFLSQL